MLRLPRFMFIRANAKECSWSDMKEAIADYDKAINLEPDFTLALPASRGAVKNVFLVNMRKLLQTTTKQLELKPDSAAEAYLTVEVVAKGCDWST